MDTTAATLPALHLGHSHGTLDTVGYDVIRTSQAGARVQIEVTEVIDGGGNAAQALEAAKAHRTPTSYGYTLPRYADGCREVAYTARQGGVDLIADAGA